MERTSIQKIKKIIVKILLKLPYLGNLIRSRNKLEKERNYLQIKLNNQKYSQEIKKVNFKKITAQKNKISIDGVYKYLKNKKHIFDVGTGPNVSDWWLNVDKNTQITGIDTSFFPKTKPEHVDIYKFDASLLSKLKTNQIIPKYIKENQYKKEKVDWKDKFDLVIANHVFEHIDSVPGLIKGLSKITKKGSIVYVGFPDYRNFTDIFYHLIHAEGGGHIQKLTDISMEEYFKKEGFTLIKKNIWPDNWLWFENSYDFKGRSLVYIDQIQISKLCQIFRKELTLKKGYFYGWEMIFKKQ